MDYIDDDILHVIQRLWVNDIPFKVNIFGWRLLLAKHQTRGALAACGLFFKKKCG
jgi:hypothetical protein